MSHKKISIGKMRAIRTNDGEKREKREKRIELKDVTKEKTNRVPLGVKFGERNGSFLRDPR